MDDKLGTAAGLDAAGTHGVVPRVNKDRRQSSDASLFPCRDEGSDDSELEDVTPVKRTPRRRNRDRRKRVASSEDDSDDGGILSSNAKRRRLVHKGALGAEESPEHGAEGTPALNGGARISQAGRRSRRDKQLRKLRQRRRQREGVGKVDETSSSSDEDRRAMYDTDPENPALSQFDDEESDDQLVAAGRNEDDKVGESSTRQATNTDMDDFIDDSATTSLPGADLGIPLEFTAQARKPMEAYFLDAVEWLVHCHINPSFDKNSPTYRMAWHKLGDEVQGLAVSRFSSSAWAAEFHRTLRARPYIDEYILDTWDANGEDWDNCQACNRTNHPATCSIRFTGVPYDPESLEDLSTGSSSEDDEDRDEDGRSIAADDHEWVVGAVCASNAQTAHELYHWKHSLKDHVGHLLTAKGFLSEEKLAEREHLSASQLGELCEAIREDWVGSGVVEELYQGFTTMLEDARIKPTTVRKRATR
ncbi:hypothetical protein MAPG_08046 [Magnaporthiopsis poae ATCC 64411]|uniref:DUF4211 domain-containing protein n=1 Tax=Magnaporthiopsis poae (strain ATCC 64411 / 73-15) TaxID=644358 RepID=A0A0C4E6B4_MAGP6|nr:hypothetical protein MAPG_08046 [Magnaporthiopsis poae ATCC 64411]